MTDEQIFIGYAVPLYTAQMRRSVYQQNLRLLLCPAP